MPSTSNNTCSLGSYLGMVDLWYDCNVCSLGQMIPDLARTVCQKMGRCLAYLPYLGKKNEHTCMFSWFSHSVWNEEVWKFLSVFFFNISLCKCKASNCSLWKTCSSCQFCLHINFSKIIRPFIDLYIKKFVNKCQSKSQIYLHYHAYEISVDKRIF